MRILKRRAGWVRVAALLVLAASAVGSGPACRGSEVELLVPAYFYPTDAPGGDWQRLAASAAKVSVTAILNPDSGPGPRADPAYVRAVSAFRKAGGRVIGYVHTSYGKRAAAAVMGDINAYLKFYQIDGVFIDEMADADDPTLRAYYASVYAHVKRANADLRVVGNPGATTKEQGVYLTDRTADALVIFEGTDAQYPKFRPFPWTRNYPASRIGQIIHGVPAGQLKQVFTRAHGLGAGLVYVTDLPAAPNPYARLPGYWETLVTLAAAAGRGERTAPSGTPGPGNP